VTRGGVKARGGLVEEDQIRIADQGKGQIEAATLSAGELLGADITLLGELDELDDLVDRPLPNVVAAVHLDQLGDRQIFLDAALLKDDPDLFTEGSRPGGRIDPEDAGLPTGSRPVALQDLDDRRLAGAVRPQQAKDLAAGDFEADTAHRLGVAVCLAQVADLDRRDRAGNGV
jgi:hypothetical protein